MQLRDIVNVFIINSLDTNLSTLNCSISIKKNA